MELREEAQVASASAVEGLQYKAHNSPMSNSPSNANCFLGNRQFSSLWDLQSKLRKHSIPWELSSQMPLCQKEFHVFLNWESVPSGTEEFAAHRGP